MKLQKLFKHFLFVSLIGFTAAMHSADNPGAFNFDGLLMDGESPMTGSVAIKVQIYGGTPTTPTNCLLYEEQHSTVALDDGAFSIKVGTGTRNSNASTGDAGVVSWKQLFSNKTGVAIRAGSGGTTCTSGYTPAALDIRYMRVTVDNGSPLTLTPDFKILSVPFATTADTLQGLIPADFVSAKASQVDLFNTSKTNSLSLKAPASFGTDVIYEWPATPINNYVLSTDGAGVMSWVAQASGLSTGGGTMTGPISMGGNDISSSGNIDLSSQKTLKLGSFTNSEQTSISTPGAIWYNTDSQTLAFRNGSVIKTVGEGTVTTVNAGTGLTGGSITTTGTLSVNAGITANQIPQLNASSQVALGNGVAALPTYSFASDPDNGMFSPLANSVAFSTLGAERMRINSSGNVGIGTSSPGSKLDVGNVSDPVNEILVNASSTGRSSIFLNSDGNVTYGLVANYSGSTYQGVANGSVGILTGNPAPFAIVLNTTERLRINHVNGYVGIGTAAPAVELDVAGTKAIRVPSGSTAMQPTGMNGMLRYNTDKADLEYYSGTAWRTPTAPKPPLSTPINASSYTVDASDYSLIFDTTNCTVTLPTASLFPGRILIIKNIGGVSVSASSAVVLPQASNTPNVAILPATAGKFAMLQSNGFNWVTMMSN